MWSFIIIVVTSTLLAVAVACDAPGSFALSDISSTPLAAGFQRHLHVSERVAKALVIPALFASGSSFFFVGGKQLRSMAESGLFPAWVAASGGSYRTPHAALLVLGTLSLILLCLSYFIGGDVFISIVACGSHATIFADIAILAAFLQFRSKFSNLEKWFYNPLGTLSVVYGISLLVITCVVTTVLHYLAFAPLLLIVVILLLATVYYSTTVRSKQGFSDEEQRVMFSAYVINGKFGLLALIPLLGSTDCLHCFQQIVCTEIEEAQQTIRGGQLFPFPTLCRPSSSRRYLQENSPFPATPSAAICTLYLSVTMLSPTASMVPLSGLCRSRPRV